MIQFHPIPTATARAYQSGGPDAYGAAPERAISDGAGNPCRHCLQNIAEGAPMLILAHRPFETPQPYAETGPIFLCANPCPATTPSAELPAIFDGSQYITRAYGLDERIIYGTGSVTARAEITTRAQALLERADVAHVDVRSASNNCYLARIKRA